MVLVVGTESEITITGRQATLAALDGRTGELRWKAGRDTGGYSSPAAVTCAGVRQVIAVTGSSVLGVRADDGRLYGRGSTDMKGFVAATLAAVADADPSALRAPLHVAISHDEELGCLGLPPLLDALTDGDSGVSGLAGVIVVGWLGYLLLAHPSGSEAYFFSTMTPFGAAAAAWLLAVLVRGRDRRAVRVDHRDQP